VTGVQTCALPISPKPQNPYVSMNVINNMKEIFANLIVFQLVTSEWFQKKMKLTHLDNKGKRIFTSIIFLGFFVLYLGVHIVSKSCDSNFLR